MVSFATKSVNSTFPKINLISQLMDNKVTAIVAMVGTVALLNYFGKLNEGDSVKVILAVVCTLSLKLKERYCTLEK